MTSEGIEKGVYECHEIIENAVKKTQVFKKKPEKKRKPKNKNFLDSDLGFKEKGDPYLKRKTFDKVSL